MSRRRARQELRNISQLDVTPLVDLTFLLLIVFMITAPALEYALDVTPPSYDAREIEPKKHKVITLTRSGQYIMSETTYDRAGLRSTLEGLYAINPKTELYVRADETRQYGEVMDLMRLVRDAGFDQVSLVTQAEE